MSCSCGIFPDDFLPFIPLFKGLLESSDENLASSSSEIISSVPFEIWDQIFLYSSLEDYFSLASLLPFLRSIALNDHTISQYLRHNICCDSSGNTVSHRIGTKMMGFYRKKYDTYQIWGYFVNNKREGRWCMVDTFHSCDFPTYETCNYHRGMRHGKSKLTVDDFVVSRVNYVDGKLQGPGNFCCCVDNHVVCSSNFVDGLKSGIETIYRHGVLETEQNWYAGFLHGLCRHFYPDGSLLYEANYHLGVVLSETFYGEKAETFYEGDGWAPRGWVRTAYQIVTRDKMDYCMYSTFFPKAIAHESTISSLLSLLFSPRCAYSIHINAMSDDLMRIKMKKLRVCLTDW